uniref:ExeA family protein n=1 Tax=Aquabacterium sp. TaxID=1872578 RepID=UPI002636AE1A
MKPAYRRPEHYMPLKLKKVLQRHGITQTDLGAAVMQAIDEPMDKTAVNLLCNWAKWPKRTPEAVIRQQIEAALRAKEVPEAEIATAFDSDEEIGRLGHGKHLAAVPDTQSPQTTEPDPYLLEPVMLTIQAKRHFKLMFNPFGADPQCADDVYLGDEQRYVASVIVEAIQNARMMAVVGESGSGKSTIWEWVQDQVREQKQPVHLIQPKVTDKARLTGVGILQAIVRDLEPHAKLRHSAELLARQAHELIADRVAEGQKCVLVFEEAHDMTVAAIKQLKRFHEFKLGWKRTLGIILLAQPELLRKLNAKGLEAREVKNRLEVVRMLPLDADLEAYAAHRLARAGLKPDALFAADAWQAIRDVLRASDGDGNVVSLCYPLLVGNLATLALNGAAE